MADDNKADTPAINRIIPHNLTARAAYNVIGNPPTTRPESGVANCYPGLEYDHRNLDRRFFPGLLVDYVSEGPRQGIQVIEVLPTERGLQFPPGNDQALAKTLAAELGALPSLTDADWFVMSVGQSDVTITMVDDTGAPLAGSAAWRLIRSLRPGSVTVRLASRARPAEDGDRDPTPPRQTYQLHGWRRTFTDPESGVIDSVYQPGELTQSLCSPWTHDFRDCSCTYWASNHPDIVFPAVPREELTQPSGRPADPRFDIEINWLRNPDYPQMHAQAMPSQRGNRPFDASYYQINHRWQDLAVVLEGRETDGLYVPRSEMRDQAVPFANDDELYDRITELAGLEHLVALLYLYALFSVITPHEAEAVRQGNWPTLADDVKFVRSVLSEVAVGEMQHLRAANTLLWELAVHTGRRPHPHVVPPATALPVPGEPRPRPAVLAPLTLKTVELFIAVERSSAYIDGQYAQVTATLQQPGYPPRLFELASTIADEGEQHFLNFSDIHGVLSLYGDDKPVYLRSVESGKPSDPDVAKALAIYRKILDLLEKGYHRENVSNQKALAESRRLMFDLQSAAEDLAARGVGVPFLSSWQ
jgi:hypothetical protein